MFGPPPKTSFHQNVTPQPKKAKKEKQEKA